MRNLQPCLQLSLADVQTMMGIFQLMVEAMVCRNVY
jgi:hypothetical protein